jgi:hypothetical protein
MVKTLPTMGALMRDHPAVLARCAFGCIVTSCALRPDVMAGTTTAMVVRELRGRRRPERPSSVQMHSGRWRGRRGPNRQAATDRPVAARTLCSGAPAFVALAVFVNDRIASQ